MRLCLDPELKLLLLVLHSMHHGLRHQIDLLE